MISVALAKSQAKSIENYVSGLQSLKNNLCAFRDSLNSAWQSDEMAHVNNAIDELANKITTLMRDLDSLSNDIVVTAKEIRDEQEAKELAEIEKLEKKMHS